MARPPGADRHHIDLHAGVAPDEGQHVVEQSRVAGAGGGRQPDANAGRRVLDIPGILRIRLHRAGLDRDAEPRGEGQTGKG